MDVMTVCPVCGQVAKKDLKTNVVRCRPFCDGTGLTVDEGRALSKAAEKWAKDVEL